jgi:hypothetical protein
LYTTVKRLWVLRCGGAGICPLAPTKEEEEEEKDEEEEAEG